MPIAERVPGIINQANRIAEQAWNAPRERSYGREKPMEMIMQQAPNAGVEAKRIWEKGVPAGEILLSTEKEAGFEDAIRNSFAFVQIAGMKNGNADTVANISTGLTWDRQSPIEDCALEIVRGIGGEEVQIVWFGPHKLLGFVKGKRPEDMLHNLVDAPKKPYEKHLPHLVRAQNQIQNLRGREIFTAPDGSGTEFLRIFNGEQEDMERAYKDNGKYSFVWNYKRQGNELFGKNLDNEPQNVLKLARDSETAELLKAMTEFFQGEDPESRFIIEFDFSATVSCCNISYNAQHSWLEDAMEKVISSFASGYRGIIRLLYPNGEEYLYCGKCQKKTKACECKKDAEEEKSFGK